MEKMRLLIETGANAFTIQRHGVTSCDRIDGDARHELIDIYEVREVENPTPDQQYIMDQFQRIWM